MVAFVSAALLSLAAVGTLAAPTVEKRTGLWHHKSDCMSRREAQVVADNYAELIRNYTDELALATLDPGFTDYSESVNTLINTCPQGDAAQTLPLLAPTFSNRTQFMIGQGQQPLINFEQLNIHHDCKSVTIRWLTNNTAPIPNPRPVVGIILLEVVKAPKRNQYPWVAKTVYSEFDSGAWLQNLEQAGICVGADASGSSPPIILPSGTIPASPIVPSGSAAPVAGSVVAPSVTAAPSGYTAAPASAADTCTTPSSATPAPTATYAA
ncbi:uncharacterized protein LTR77_001053 [Saxophila tyrrhenica]|uniref:NTF2-like domain-containing protein n=1 Tax=Saxophila tyrrhenica TaxID=1690608 RepID=A0AAV9PNY2_9PEZI|nr:hypothetical protein LTR77_001053 [Saxophila tyrrhenica]